MLVGVIQKSSLAEIKNLAAQADPDLYDLLELRLDVCADLDPEQLGKLNLPLPLILTLRPKNEGGAFAGDEEDRLRLLAGLAALHPAYLDLESFLDPGELARLSAISPQTQIILSKHDFRGTPDNLPEIFAEMRAKAPNAILKFAALAENSLDALRLMLFSRQRSLSGDKLIAISMGEAGQSSRILAPYLHSGFCYCPLDPAEASAPGQLSAAELSDVYNFKSLNRDSEIYGLLGDPVVQSLGHLLHNRQNREQGRNAVYVKWRLGRNDLPVALPLLHQLGVRGLSLTMPLKEAALPLLESIDQDAWQIGAVNTLSRLGQGWHGSNTDGKGALAALGFSPAGKHLVILGAGGAARAIIFAALGAGAKVTVFNRSPDKSLPGGLRPKAFSRLHEIRDLPYAAIINCLPFDSGFAFGSVPFRSEALALDISYNKNSPFLELAARAGCQTRDGLLMFEEQALLQRERWGLPGSGKTL